MPMRISGATKHVMIEIASVKLTRNSPVAIFPSNDNDNNFYFIIIRRASADSPYMRQSSLPASQHLNAFGLLMIYP